jgi:leader peptidase (prepilin peptidase)/N-methyltransferase
MQLIDFQNFLALHPNITAVFIGAFGACVGSFLNVCIHRLPKGESIISPPSHCACGQKIPVWFNIPLLGWLLLRGRAKCCGATISVQYPLVELITALLFVTAFLALSPVKAAIGCVFLSLLIILAGCDMKDMLVPDAPNFLLVGLGLFFSIVAPLLHRETGSSLEIISAMDSLIGIAVGTALVWWIRTIASFIMGQEAMGEADIILCAGVGAFCGWQGALFCLFGGSVIGVIIKFRSVLALFGPKKEPESVPFVPSMAIAAAVWFFRGPELVSAWHLFAGKFIRFLACLPTQG